MKKLFLDDNGSIVPDGYAAVKWLVYESGLNLWNLKFYVHSANLAKNIIASPRNVLPLALFSSADLKSIEGISLRLIK